jgi:hypothetical protein
VSKIIREITEWPDVEYTPVNHDYLVLADGRCIAVRKAGTEEWEKFSRPLNFSRSHRRFKTLKEEEPAHFIEPYQKDGWEQNSYNSLEAYFA